MKGFRVYVICRQLPELPREKTTALIASADFVAVSFAPIKVGDILDHTTIQGPGPRLPQQPMCCMEVHEQGKIVILQPIEEKRKR